MSTTGIYNYATNYTASRLTTQTLNWVLSLSRNCHSHTEHASIWCNELTPSDMLLELGSSSALLLCQPFHRVITACRLEHVWSKGRQLLLECVGHIS